MKTKKYDYGFVMTLLFAAIIIALAFSTFIPTITDRAQPSAAEQALDGEAISALNCCADYVSGRAFKTSMSGTIKAKVIGIPYTQKISGTRTVDKSSYCEVAESVSALVKAAVKREINGGVYSVSRGTYKNKKFVYGKSENLSEKNYVDSYGKPNLKLVKYSLDGAITHARKINDGTYKYTLEPTKATEYSRNEVKTMLGGKSYPKYSSVEFTLVTDGEKPIKIISVEKFRVEKFGGANCTAKYEERFDF